MNKENKEKAREKIKLLKCISHLALEYEKKIYIRHTKYFDKIFGKKAFKKVIYAEFKNSDL